MLKNLIQIIRKHEKLAVFALLIMIALGFGITGTVLDVLSGRKNAENLAGEIFGKEISNQEFESVKYRWRIWSKFQRMSAFAGAYYFWFQHPAPYDMVDLDWLSEEESISPDEIQELTWAVLLLNELADHAGIKVNESEVRQVLRALFASRNSEFDPQYYQWILQQRLQISAVAFEKTMAEFLKINKYRRLIDTAVIPNLEELYQAYLERNEQLKVKYVVFRPEDFIDQAKVDLGEVKTYFQNNAKNYEVPEKFQIEYVLAENEALKKEVKEPTQEELQKFYDQHKEDYKITTVAGVVLTSPTYKPLKQVRDEIKRELMEESAKDLGLDKMTEIQNKISGLYLQDKPIDLLTLAQEYNLKCPISNFFTRNQINELEKEIGSSPDPDLNRQIPTFQENEISDIVSTSKGYLIFRLLKKQSAYTPKLTAQLKKKVLHDLKQFKALELAKESAHSSVKEITATVKKETQDIQDKPESERRERIIQIRLRCFDEIAVQRGLKYTETTYFTKEGTIANFKEAGSEFKQTAFKMERSDYTTVLDNNAYCVMQLIQRRAASGEDFDDQKSFLASELRQKKQKEFLHHWIESIKRESQFKIYTSASPKEQ